MDEREPLGASEPAPEPSREPNYARPAAEPPNTVIEPENGLISVNNCPVCRGHHHRIPYRPMHQTLGLFNHFYECEETGEPVPVSIATLDGKTLEIPQFMAAAIVRGVLSGKWLFVMTRIEGSEIKLDRQTCSFPREDLTRTLDLLAADLRKEVDPMADRKIEVEPPRPANIMDLFKTRNQG